MEVSARLANLGLSPEILVNAIVAGQVGRADCTRNDPPSFAGITAYAVTTRSLRDQLLPGGWEKSDAGNYSTVVNPDRSMAIVVATGDDNTGLESKTPKTKFPKGPATAAAVQRNQLDFLELLGEKSAVVDPEPPPPMTWMLLIGRQRGGVRAELSLPDGVGEDNRVESWIERIILGDLPGDDGFDLPLPENGPELDIDVVRIIG